VDAASIELLYRTHGHLVLRRARRLLGHEEDAREVLHEVFASLLDRPAQFRAASSPTTWLYAATTHACLNLLRNARTRARLLAASPPSDGRAPSQSPEAAVVLRDLLARVPEDLAHVAVYYYADEMTHDEIAAVLGCSRRHVGDLVERLHASLRTLEEAS
jgi:RNA polymerase sigma-70 factor (ECF subfamily)